MQTLVTVGMSLFTENMIWLWFVAGTAGFVVHMIHRLAAETSRMCRTRTSETTPH
jgi:hypothetical protein